MTAPLLQLSQVSKSFPPAVRALAGIDFEIAPGEVHALVGENGAGKSTLSRIIAGIEPADSGRMHLEGGVYAPANRPAAEAAGIRMVMQELNLLPTLSVAENLFLRRLPHRLGVIHRGRLRKQARDALAAVGLEGLDPDTPAGALGIGRQQLVEIASGLTTRCRILILDEPTAALSDHEAEFLFTQIARLKAAGVAVLYISHRMPEITRLADRITILRDGHLVATRLAADIPLPEIIRLMVGREIATAILEKRPPTAEVALDARHLAAPPSVRDVSLTLHRGEILGLSGLMGSGRTETLRLLFGADPRAGGTLYLRGNPVAIRSPRDAVAQGIALLTEDRKAQGLLLAWSIRQNTSLPSLSSLRNGLGFIRTAAETKAAADQARSLDIRCHSLEQSTRELSGGNQQKVVLAKWLLKDADILLFDEPTRGIDVGAKFEIYRLLITLASQGKAILVVSSELPELITLCHRIAVLSAGTLVETFDPPFNADQIMSAALAHHVTGTRTSA